MSFDLIVTIRPSFNVNVAVVFFAPIRLICFCIAILMIYFAFLNTYNRLYVCVSVWIALSDFFGDCSGNLTLHTNERLPFGEFIMAIVI